MLNITYGYAIAPSSQDPLVQLIRDVMTHLSLTLVPLFWAADIIPALRYLPDWFPGTSFKQTAREWKTMNDAVISTPYSYVQKQVEMGTYQQKSYVSEHIKSCGHGDGTGLSEEDVFNIQLTATSMYGGGSDTTAATMEAFILAMILFPKVQLKAQEELDRVVGSDRLPDYEDRENLPYVNAIAKEVLRYFPMAPAGAAHATEDDIIFRGYHIPKGSYILPSVWWFLHDPKVYQDPLSFDPDRFLEPRNEPDPASDVFGYGRRICPGQHLVPLSLYITISRMLAAFTITKAMDENGKEIDVELKHTPGLIDKPVSFAYAITPRNKKYIDLVREVEADHPWQKSDSGSLEGDVIEKYKKRFNQMK